MTAYLSRACALALLTASAIVSAVPAQAKPTVEVAFVLDTTGSMASLIEGAKRKIWSIATTIIDDNPGADIRMGLVAYRDIGDEYVTKRIELTTDIQDLYAQLLELRARGGGDWPESVNEALHEGITKLSWTSGPEVSRIVFLVGDAPPHMDYQQDMKYPQVLALAKQKDIVVNAVQAGEARDTLRVWREIAQMGDGQYIPIPQDGGKLVVIETPFDVEIIELQEKLNGTVIPYGPRHKRSSVEEKTRQVCQRIRSRRRPTWPELPEQAGAHGECRRSDYRRRRPRRRCHSRTPAALAVKDDELPEAIRAMKPEERQATISETDGATARR